MSRITLRLSGSLLALLLFITAFGASPVRGGQHGGGSAAPSGGAAAWMYNPTALVNINLDIPQSSMDQISCDMGAPRPYVPATFTMTYTSVVRGKSVVKTYGPWNVGVHVKGWYGSFRCLPGGDKAGLKVKFTDSSERIDGIKKLTLNNFAQDGTYAHEALTYQIFRAMNIAAPRTGFAHVSINGEPRGLYLNLETIDTVSLPRWYPTTTHLYEGAYGSWWGNLADPFSNHYSVDEGSESDRSDLQQLITTALDTSPGWYARMAPIADLEQMTRMWATEWFVGHWDGYSQHLPNNYYLHRDGAGRFTMLPWGVDQTFGWADPPYSGWDNFLLVNCLTDPICAAMYSDALRSVTSTVQSMNFGKQADTVYATIAADGGWVEDTKSWVTARLIDFNAWAATAPAQPRSITVTNVRGATRVSWQKPLVTTGISGYVVEYKSRTLPWTQLVAAASATSINLPKLSAGTYELRIRSVLDEASRASTLIAGYQWYPAPATSLPLAKTNIRIR